MIVDVEFKIENLFRVLDIGYLGNVQCLELRFEIDDALFPTIKTLGIYTGFILGDLNQIKLSFYISSKQTHLTQHFQVYVMIKEHTLNTKTTIYIHRMSQRPQTCDVKYPVNAVCSVICAYTA